MDRSELRAKIAIDLTRNRIIMADLAAGVGKKEYLSPGQHAPKGTTEQTGAHGGRFYISQMMGKLVRQAGEFKTKSSEGMQGQYHGKETIHDDPYNIQGWDVATIDPRLDTNVAKAYPSNVVKMATVQRLQTIQKVEPEMTNTMQDIAQVCGGKLEGLDFRLKSPESTLRKVYEKINECPYYDPQNAVSNLKDLVRYTLLFEPGNYTNGVKNSIDLMKRHGFEPVAVKNYWGSEGYQGINCNFKNKDGVVFELQFHTPQSIDIKEKQSHPLYEKLRVTKDPKEINQLSAQISNLWKSVERPQGADAI